MLRPVHRLALLGLLTTLAFSFTAHPAAAHDLIYRWQRQMTPWHRLTREERCLPPPPRPRAAPRPPGARGGRPHREGRYEYHPEETGFGYYDQLNKTRSKDWRTRLPGLNNETPSTNLEPIPLDQARENLLEDLKNGIPPTPAPAETGNDFPIPEPQQ